ncbi:MAG: hypothetical protein KDD69_04245 [Bdellovibrionales bacterium]|nr:hypothetical protein [Bdellovibrionales bacterium]
MMSYTKKAPKYKSIRRGIVLIHFSTDPSKIARELLAQIAEVGFDTVQVPVLDINAKSEYVALAERAAEQGLVCSVVTVCPAGKDEGGLFLADPGGSGRAQEVFETYMAGVVDIAVAMRMFADEPVKVVGPFAEPLGGASTPEDANPASDRWRRSVVTLARVARNAADKGAVLLLEFLNRWEQRLVCNSIRGRLFVEQVNAHPASGEATVYGLYDSHHAHIEGGKDIARELVDFIPVLGGYHASESHRGVLGTGRTTAELEIREIQHAGLGSTAQPFDVWIEMFSGSDPGLAAATCVWDSQITGRELEASAESLRELDRYITRAGYALNLG